MPAPPPPALGRRCARASHALDTADPGASPRHPLLTRGVLALSFLAFAVLGTSCTTIVHDYDGPRDITPGTRLTVPSARVLDLSGEKKAFYLLFGLIPLNSGSGAELADDVLVEYLGEDAAGVTHIEIYEGFTTWDVIRNLLFGAVVSTRTVAVRGQGHLRADDPRVGAMQQGAAR